MDAEAKAEVEWLIKLVSAIRTGRTELNVSPGQRLIGYLESPDPETFDFVAKNQDALLRMAKVSFDATPGSREGPTLRVQAGNSELVMLLAGAMDITAEKVRLTKALEASTKEAKSLEGRLSNPAFVEKAKPEAVDKARADHAMHAAEAERLAAALARLG